MFSIFKKKEQAQQQTLPSKSIQQQQQVIQQSPVVPPQQPATKESMFKGSLKVKAPPPQAQEVPQQQQKPLVQTQNNQCQSNSNILSPESNASKQQFNQVETPTPQDELNVDQKLEIKIDVDEVKKKPIGFGFLKKKQPEQPLLTDESVQGQAESQIIYEIQVKQNQAQEINQEQEQTLYLNYSPQQQIMNDVQIEQVQNQIDKDEKEIQQQQLELYHQQQEEQILQINNNIINKSQQNLYTINSELENTYINKHKMIMEELQYFQNEVNYRKVQFYISQQEIEQCIVSYQQQLQECNSHLSQFLIEQQVYVKQEQFERAEEIELCLKQIQDKITQIDNYIKLEEQKYNKLQNEKDNIRGEEYKFYQEIEKKLEEIERQHLKYTDQCRLEGQQQIKKQQQHVEEENERLKIQQIHTEIDSKNLSEEELHLNQIMDNQTKEYRIQQQQLINKKSIVESEIEELQLYINQKKNELQKATYDLVSTKEKIQQVQQKFNLQLMKVQNKRTKLNDEFNSLANERAQIEKLEGYNLRQQNEHKNTIEYQQQQLEMIRIKRNELIQKYTVISEQCQQEFDVTCKYQEAKNASIEALKELKQVQSQVDELNYQRNLGQTQLHEIFNKKSELLNKLPKMNDDKAQLVQNKNFKGAAEINQQIKEVQRQITLYEDKITYNKNIETQILKQIDEITNLFLSKLHRYNQLQQNAEVCRYFVLELKLEDISQIDYFGLSQIQLDIQNEITKLFHKYQHLIYTNPKVSIHNVDQIQQYQVELNKDTYEDHQEQNHKAKDEQVDSIEKQQANFIEISEEQKQNYIQGQQQLYWEIRQQIMQVEEQVSNHVQNEQYENAQEIQEEVDRLTIQANAIEVELKQKFNIDKLIPEEVDY